MTENSIVGYAAVFYRGEPTSEANIGGDFIERVKPGAFARALRGVGGVACYTNHDPNFLLGREGTDPVSLILHEDATGLHIRIFPFSTAAGRDALEMVRVGGLRGMSFGFSMVNGKDEWHLENGHQIRTIEEVGKLIDASPVVHPAYAGTSCQIDQASRSTAEKLARYEERTRRLYNPKTEGSPIFTERADDRGRGTRRAELQLASRLRLYSRRAGLIAEREKPVSKEREDAIAAELADIVRKERNLAQCIGE